jgi:hypothetical protein
MIFVLSIFYEVTVVARYLYDGIPSMIYSTIIIMENFMQSIIFLRLV